MADFDFNDNTDKRKPSQRDSVMLLLLCLVVLVIIVVSIMGFNRTAQLRELTNELSRMEQFMHSPETQNLIDEYYSVQDTIATLSRTRRPLQFAHTHYKMRSSATSSLVDGAIWEPMRNEEKNIAFRRLQILGVNVRVDTAVDNLDTARLYQLALGEKTVIIDEHGVDKWPGAPSAEGDQEISRFSRRFTHDYMLNRDSEDRPYDVLLRAWLNKDVSAAIMEILWGFEEAYQI